MACSITRTDNDPGLGRDMAWLSYTEVIRMIYLYGMDLARYHAVVTENSIILEMFTHNPQIFVIQWYAVVSVLLMELTIIQANRQQWHIIGHQYLQIHLK